MKVDFIIMGAQKCATTTLFEILTRHPGIIGSRIKEPHFFSTSPDWRRELPRYEGLFDERPGARYCEASTSYTFYPHRNLEIWEDIYTYNSAMKFIYLVRNPVDRIISSYMHYVSRGYTNEPIDRHLRSNPLLLDATRYFTQIIPFVRRFGRDRVLLIDFDDFIKKRQDVLQSTAHFIRIDPDGFIGSEDIHANASVRQRPRHHRFDDPSPLLRSVRKLWPGLWSQMVSTFSPTVAERPTLPKSLRRAVIHILDLEIRELENLMGKSLESWRRAEPDLDAAGPSKTLEGRAQVTQTSQRTPRAGSTF